MKISIAMATYNGQAYLSEQLQSFVNQTRMPDELVVCDDQSTDSTLELLNSFSRQSPFTVKVIRNAITLGYAKNFEKAMQLCTGDLVFLSDQDDVWMPEKIERLQNIFQHTTWVYLVQSNMMIVDQALTSYGASQLDNVVALTGKKSKFNTGCGMVFRKEFLNVALPIPSNLWGHDLWLGRLARALRVSVLVKEPLMYYRRHDVNASNWLASHTKRLSRLESFKTHGQWDSKAGWQNEEQRIQEIMDQLIERKKEVAENFGSNRLMDALERLRQQQYVYQRRASIISRPRIKRAPLVVLFWCKGGYDIYRGWRSALKDLIRE